MPAQQPKTLQDFLPKLPTPVDVAEQEKRRKALRELTDKKND